MRCRTTLSCVSSSASKSLRRVVTRASDSLASCLTRARARGWAANSWCRATSAASGYEQAAAAVQAHDDHAQFWQEQLGNIRAGQPYKLLVQTKEGWRIGNQLFDPKDPSAEGHVLAKLTENITARQTWQQKLAEIPTGHKKTYGEFTGRVTQLDKELFEKATAPQFTQAVAKTLEQWPAGLRGRPEIALIAKMQVAGQLLLNRIQALEAQAQAKGNSVAALKNAAPAPVDTGGITPPDNTAAAVAELNRLTQSRW